MNSAIARTRALILAYGLLSAAFYCALLPLWEGFDEFYHYGYVQHVSTTWSIPVIWKTPISRELWNSLDFEPVSHFLQPYFQRPTTKFEDYFRLSADQRIARRQALDTIPSALRREPSPRDDYEAKQSPLSYLLLAPFDRLLASASLSTRDRRERSEEHTSELQSHLNLVCRLLLEKKKTTQQLNTQ